MWPNMVSYLSIIIFNDNSLQMSVKQIPLHIKAKRKIHETLGHKNTTYILLILTVYF